MSSNVASDLEHTEEDRPHSITHRNLPILAPSVDYRSELNIADAKKQEYSAATQKVREWQNMVRDINKTLRQLQESARPNEEPSLLYSGKPTLLDPAWTLARQRRRGVL
ncbi:hypothetical protein LTR91_020511 [Friedmanniomyces endolithicus]|uniref:Uncharacterized protein n=1 Tax=Friedmanniomyces endolithicus TaxID=329885 RepID=A0AAN6HBY6_9PEZI|nr:hypothetical protein LTR01_008856 [Friedmanniomyces endolithicus]KAK0960109.1 hypothetical protein LTR91_020511 [Friedmanniomyces endolithicus]